MKLVQLRDPAIIGVCRENFKAPMPESTSDDAMPVVKATQSLAVQRWKCGQQLSSLRERRDTVNENLLHQWSRVTRLERMHVRCSVNMNREDALTGDYHFYG